MPDLSAARITHCMIHKVGNKQTGEDIIISRKQTPIHHEGLRNVLTQFLTSPFREDDIHRFHHHSALDMNEIYVAVTGLFKAPDEIENHSATIARHLFESTVHPNVPGGELCVACFDDCYLDGLTSQAIVIAKTEQWESFLQFQPFEDSLAAVYQMGINIKRPDKACIIFDQEKDMGYKILLVENRKSGDTMYWRDTFLGVIPASDDFHHTQNMLRITREFVTRELPATVEVDKAESIDMLNRSLDYFKTHDAFEKQDFIDTVFDDDNVREAFSKYDVDYRKYNEMEDAGSFGIDEKAVKKQAKIFKSVLKLDRNFHIYIHGNRNMIEKGTEPDGRKYYKIYYNEEN